MVNTTNRSNTISVAVPEDSLQQKFDELLARYRSRIVLYLFSLVQQTADAEDLCQRCSLIMWRKFPEFDQQRSFLAWACGIARKEAMNYRRARSTDRLQFQSDIAELLAVSLESLEEEQEKHRLDALKQCIQSLPETDQGFLQRIYWEGAAFEAVADEWGCSLKTFYNRMSLLRRRLLRCVSRRLNLEILDQQR